MKRIAFIVHGKIRKRDKLVERVRDVFSTDELNFEFTEYNGHAIELSYKVAMNNAMYIVCVGGDGSLNEVVNGVMRAKSEEQESDIKIGLLPYGTGNDFARTVGVSNDLAALKKYIDEGSYKKLDIGLAEYKNIDGSIASRYFINITDVGIGGVIVRKLAHSSKFLGAVITYQKAIVSALLSYRYQPVRISAREFSYEGEIMLALAANGKYIGGGLGIAPEAVPNDGLLAVVVVGKVSLWDYLKNIGNIKSARRVKHPEIKYYSTTEVYIESLNEPLPIDMDGEFVGYSPLRVKIVPAGVKFLCSQ